MNILLFGVSNVGKTSTGELLAGYLGYDFYDIDEEVKKELNTTLEDFVSHGTLYERDRIRCDILRSLMRIKSDKVVAVTPLSHITDIEPLLSSPDVLAIELRDSAENIFSRLVFSDENDVIYTDDEYKNSHAGYYLSKIREDIEWYGSVYETIGNHFDMSGMTASETAEALIAAHHLGKE